MKIILTVAIKFRFNAKMHQIQFWLGSGPGPAEELIALPWPPSWWRGGWLVAALP